MTMDVTANQSLAPLTDRLGKMLLGIKDTLVASGLWVVTGSGDGIAAFANQGQTAGPSYDVFTAPTPYGLTSTWPINVANTISNNFCWMQLKEIGTTRVFQFQRASSIYPERLSMRLCPGGVAVAGANSNTAPAPVGSAQDIMGSVSAKSTIVFATSGLLFTTSTHEAIYHLWWATSARAGGVCPFYFMVFNKVTNVLGGAFFYESMLDIQAANTEPWLISTGVDYASVVGAIGSTGQGPFHATAGRSSGVGTLWAFDRMHNAAYGTYFPGEYVPAVEDGKWRLPYCRARGTPTGVYLGRAEHLLPNYVARDYPTTFDLATADARIAMGQLLFPWKQDVVPAWGP